MKGNCRNPAATSAALPHLQTILVPCIPFDGGKSGISVYIREVVRALRADGHRVLCVFEGEPPAEDWIGAPIVVPRHGALFSMLYHLFLLPFRIRRLRPDLCLLPAANRRALVWYPVPTVAVVHDLSQYHVKAKYDAFRLFYVKRLLPFFVRRATSVVAISQSTANDLVRFWRLPEKKVSVVYNGFTPPKVLRTQGRTDQTAGSVLYISRLEHPGKNHVGLIEAYGKLSRDLAERHPLVLVGGDWNGAEAVHAVAEASPYRDLIQFRGFVADADLSVIWADAAAYVFPSRFEGFGLSLLEAMSAGIPCACSQTSSLGELGVGVAELFDPERPDDIARALKTILTTRNEARVAAGRQRAAAFSWTNCARGLLAALPKAEVFGVPIDCTTQADAVRDLVAAATATERPARPAFFAFVNAHCLNVAYADTDYAAVLRTATRVWPDGTGVRLAGRRLGFPVPENVNGTDLFPLICAAAEREGFSLFFYGARPAVVEQVVAHVRRDFPRARIAGFCDGYGDDAVAVARINAARPDLLFVAKGVPLQEKWIAAHRDALACRAAVAVGGLFDFVSGRIPRAPAWMRRLGVEWLFRLYQEPVRLFRRYVVGNPLFLWRLSRHRGADDIRSDSISLP